MGERKTFISILKFIAFIFWLIFQFIAIALIFNIFNIFFIYYFIFFEFISAVSVIHLNYKDKNTSYKISWIALILLIPVVGVIIYILSRIGIKRNFNKMNKMELDEKIFPEENESMLSMLKSENKTRYNQTRLIKNISGYGVYFNTKINYFSSGESMYKSLLKELKKADKFIFLEYFIISRGKMWDEIFEVLKEKAQSGVEVRILVDYIGSMFALPKDFEESLKKNNIKYKIFNPIKILLNVMLNYRDHRKIAVIDGKIAFTGGMNIGDEYINSYRKYGYWKDMGVCLEGNAVYSFTSMFLRMWQSITKKRENFRKYKFESEFNEYTGIVVPYNSSPEESNDVAQDVYLSIIDSAKDYIYITTPYLVIGYEMILALSLAAKRGVDVRILTPSIPDKKTIQILTRSHYDKLLDSGVKIYEYTPGFIHGKTFVSDGECAVVGTINMDYRSLYLHFECAVYMYDVPIIKDIYNDFISTIKVSKKIEKKTWEKRCFLKRVLESILRMFAPLA
ncbi:cardiolipin synthase [Clostridium luticellarii]|uniref:Cardiolipin synthase n=1 Tax=Clostridium luticellarii TaxID=1691940 RepID=A0A2T0BMT1_9CLOT|nr:cardiolipin synthase [Clostridium luticellarii]MCI1944024.1 cardiolipin synthase [Clostridium luticellarii]MCI1967334.1 cardiolipin synthase [Clostridium luticellarii]MCI1995525.1 cardiolipin synthase [Clostridium luticellarii]MCI2039180.1 cardiolipin synthase [Clostridium luticellarii]PRR85190.1 putative cardiolipin synthase YwiE [Clostridium luticellarii]